MEDYEVREKEREGKSEKMKKAGTSLVGGSIFGITAGLIIVVILSVFPQTGNAVSSPLAAAPEVTSGRDRRR